MSKLIIKDVRTFENELGIKFQITSPKKNNSINTYHFTVSGWIISSKAKISSIQAIYHQRTISDIVLSKGNKQAIHKIQNKLDKNLLRFRGDVGSIGMPNNFNVDVIATLANSNQVPLVRINIQRSGISHSYQPKINPIMLTSTGRSGTTWFMRILSEHDQIALHNIHPYETMAASYWLHAFKVLSDPANHTSSTRKIGFMDNHSWVGHNPYYSPPLTSHQSMKEWFGNDFVEQNADHTLRTIDDYYFRLSSLEGKSPPLFFAEKTRSTHLQWIFHDLYPDPKEIFLIRDFRDTICSMLAFNKKRGFVGVGPLNAKSDEDFIRLFRPQVETLVNAYSERKTSGLLILYEHLLLNPEGILKNILQYLGLEHSDSQVKEILQRTSKDSKISKTDRGKKIMDQLVRFVKKESTGSEALKSHQTSSGSSIGRWKTDLNADLQRVCDESFSDLLDVFEYPPTFN